MPIHAPKAMGKNKPPKPPLPLGARGPPSNSPIPPPTPLTTPNEARSIHALPHNYASKSQLVTMGRCKFTRKLPLSLRRSPPHLIHPSLDRPTRHPKRHPDPLSRFATIYFPDGQTDRPTDTETDRWERRQVSKKSAYARYIDRERRINNANDDH